MPATLTTPPNESVPAWLRRWNNDLRWGVAVFALLAVPWMMMGVASAWRWGLTSDEVSHFGAGLSYLHYGDFRMNPDHPPLVKVMVALPVYLIDPPEMDPTVTEQQHINWECSSQYHYGYHLLFRQADGRHRERLFLARLMALAIGLGGGALAFAWGREIGGCNLAGWSAAAMLMYYPEYLGHAALINYDVPMMIAGAAMAWAGWCWWRRPTWWRLVAYAVACGIASQVKVPVSMMAALQTAVLLTLAVADHRRGLVQRALLLVLSTVAAGIFAAWAGSAFRFSIVAPGLTIYQRPPVVGPYDPNDPSLLFRALAFAYDHRLLPEYALAGVAHLRSFGDRYQFLLGEVSGRGWYHYFFVTILFKTPVPMLLGAVGLAALEWRRRRGFLRTRTQRWRTCRMVIFGAAFALMALLIVNSRVNIGHRHILLVYFPWCVLLGVWAGRGLMRPGWRRWAAAGLLGSQVITTLWVFPHQSTYVNFLGGSPYRLSTIVNDSCVDWGQDLPTVRPWMDANGIKRINLSYFGKGDPASYGLTNVNWITPARVTNLYAPPVGEPDPSIPSVLSLYTLGELRRAHPQLYAREPDVLLNSYAVFLPAAASAS